MVEQGPDSRIDATETNLTVQYFEQALERARKLVENSDLDTALATLHDLEKKFFAGSRLFDLLGEVLFRQGKIDEGIRYRALYQELKSTLNSVSEGGQNYLPNAEVPRGHEIIRTEESCIEVCSEALGEPRLQAPAQTSFTPLTAAMGHELMRQGHYDRALALFNVLVERNPADEKLKEARDEVRRRIGGQHTLTTLSRWLRNIENMKAARSTKT